MVIVTVNPIVTLRGVVYSDIAEKYLRGEYVSTAIKKTKVAGVTLQEIGDSSDMHANVISIKDRSSGTHIIYRVGNDSFLSNEPYGKGIKCFNCDREAKMGIPVNVEIKTVEGKTYYIYTMVDYHCDTPCAFRCLKKGFSGPVQYRDWRFMNSEQLLRHLHSQLHPGVPLRAANDCRLLKSRGGPMDDAIFHGDSSTTYYPLPHLEFRAARSEYIARVTS